jgi:cell wall-associated NlpC family hydrolase
MVLLSISVLFVACSGTSGRVSVSDRGADVRRGQSVVDIAERHIGAPYRWGGSSPSGFDCSGLVRYVYAQVGVTLPHNAAQQFRLGRPVSRDSLEPGDLVFFDRLRHSGIYVGNGRFIHARQSGKRVSIARLDEEWYAEHWAGARRLDRTPRSIDSEE